MTMRALECSLVDLFFADDALLGFARWRGTALRVLLVGHRQLNLHAASCCNVGRSQKVYTFVKHFNPTGDLGGLKLRDGRRRIAQALESEQLA
jgi:hypothetical protein